MAAPPPPRDPLFEVEHLSLAYAGYAASHRPLASKTYRSGSSAAARSSWAALGLGQVLLAIKYQLVVVFMQAAAAAPASLLFVPLAVGRYLTPAHQFRRYLL